MKYQAELMFGTARPAGDGWKPLNGMWTPDGLCIVWEREDPEFYGGEQDMPSDLEQANALLLAQRKIIAKLKAELKQEQTRVLSRDKTLNDHIKLIEEIQKRLIEKEQRGGDTEQAEGG